MSPPPDDKRRPVEPSLPGVARAIDEVLRTQDQARRAQTEQGETLERVEGTLIVHGHRIDRVERKVEGLVVQGTELNDRVVDLERIPRAIVPTPGHGHRTAPGATLVRAADSIPPEVASLGKESKSGSWTWDAEAMSSVIVGMREQIDGLEQAREVEEKLKAQAEKDAISAERKNARLRGWLALTLSGLVILGALFAYLAPRLGK